MNDKSRILVVDDDPGLLRLLSMRLSSAGYVTETAAEGNAALARMDIFQPHLVITDLRMGRMDGMTLFREIHARNPTLAVIVLTAHGSIPDAVEATQTGVFAYLTKPFDSRILLEHVQRALALTHPQSPNGEADDHDGWRSAIISRSTTMDNLLAQARRVADSDVSVLIRGESGTGKELLAQAIHNASARSAKPFVAVNCSAIPEALLESELFGHVRGAFTGATSGHQGLFAAASGGTLFLDEIGDMPLNFQAKLLRALELKEVRPVGSTVSTHVDIRVLCATHRDLKQRVADREFREDLYYRLNVVLLELPPLKDRREDIPLLVAHFIEQINGRATRGIEGFSPAAMELLVKAPYQGNARHLRNIVEHAVALSPTPVISATLVRKVLRDQPDELLPLNEARDRFEREYLIRLLKLTDGNVAQAARLAQRNRTDLYKRLKHYDLEPELFRSPE